MRPGGNRWRLAVGGVGGSLLVGKLLEGVPRGSRQTETNTLGFPSEDTVGRGRRVHEPSRGLGCFRHRCLEAATGGWWAGWRSSSGSRSRSLAARLGGGRGFGVSRVDRWRPFRRGAATPRGWGRHGHGGRRGGPRWWWWDGRAEASRCDVVGRGRPCGCVVPTRLGGGRSFSRAWVERWPTHRGAATARGWGGDGQRGRLGDARRWLQWSRRLTLHSDVVVRGRAVVRAERVGIVVRGKRERVDLTEPHATSIGNEEGRLRPGQRCRRMLV